MVHRVIVTGGKALPKEANERLRALLLQLIERYDHNQSKLAPLIGVTQGTLSAFLSGRQGSSFPVALKVCELGGWDIFRDVIGELGPAAGTPEHPLRELSGFDSALAQATLRYPYVPAAMWKRVGDWQWAAESLPPTVTPEFLHDCARLLLAHVPNHTAKRGR